MIKKSATLSAVLVALALIAAGTAFAQTPVPTVSSPQPGTLVRPSKPINPTAVLWDQPLSSVNQNAYVDQEFPDFPTFSSFLADDFVNAETWMIEGIFVPGDMWNGATTLASATSLNWAIYGDNAGVPDGHPSGGGSVPFWSLSLPPGDSQVTLETGTDGYPSNTTLALTTPLALPAGTWWLVFYPTMAFSPGGEFGRQPADTTHGYTGQFINPGGGFGYGTAWRAWTVLGGAQTDIAFHIKGTEQTPCFERIVNGSFEQVGGQANVALAWTNNSNIGPWEGRKPNAAGRYFLQMLGDYYRLPNQVSQTVSLSGSPPKTLGLSMYKSSNAGSAGATAYKAILRVSYSDGTAKNWTLNLPQGNSGGWKSISTCVAPTKSYASATVALVYTHSKGIVRFDNVSLQECSLPCSSATTPGYLDPEPGPETEVSSEELQ